MPGPKTGMKILWLASWYPNPASPYDGDFIQRHARATALYVPVTVLYVSQYGEQVAIPSDLLIENDRDNVTEKITLFKFKKTGFRWLDKFRYNMRYYRVYKKIIKEYLQKNGKPDLVHVHVPVKAGWLGLWMLRRWRIAYIVSEHSSLYSKDAEDSFFKRNFFHKSVVKKILRNAVVVTNVSQTVGKTISSLFQLKSVKTIPNTVNTDFFNYTSSPVSKFRFIHVSTLTHQKNIDGMLRAIKELRKLREDFEFVFVGPLNAEVQKMTEELSLTSVISFTGEISYLQVALQMQRASALVMFSRHENFPCVIIEALCCGLPTIGTDVGGVAEAIDESNGIVVSSGNEEELLSAMKGIMNEYPKFNSEKISTDAQRRYSYAVIGKQFADLYDETLNKN